MLQSPLCNITMTHPLLILLLGITLIGSNIHAIRIQHLKTKSVDKSDTAVDVSEASRFAEVSSVTQTAKDYNPNDGAGIIIQVPWADAPAMKGIVLPEPPKAWLPPNIPLGGFTGANAALPAPPPPPPPPPPPLPLPPIAASAKYGLGPSGSPMNLNPNVFKGMLNAPRAPGYNYPPLV